MTKLVWLLVLSPVVMLLLWVLVLAVVLRLASRRRAPLPRTWWEREGP